jgi:hypothetical protein
VVRLRIELRPLAASLSSLLVFEGKDECMTQIKGVTLIERARQAKAQAKRDKIHREDDERQRLQREKETKILGSELREST